MEFGRILPFLIKIFIAVLLSCAAFAASNQSIVYQGRIVRPDGTVPNSGNITFTLAVYSPSPKKCLLYSESQTVNMTGSGGMFSLALGTGTRSDGGAHTFDKIFVNGGSLSSLTCGDGSTSYAPAATDDRSIVAAFNDNGSVVNLSAMEIKSIPFALQAQQIGGYGINDLVKVHPTTGSPTTFTTAEMAKIRGIGAAACAANEILKWNGTAWACSPDATGGAPADAAYGSSNKGIVAFDTDAATSGITVASGVAKLSSTGVTANTYGSATAVPTIAIDVQGRITSATATTIALPVSQLTQSGASNGQVLKWNGMAWAPAADVGVTADASYAAKGVVQFDTDAETSGVSVTSGVAKVNMGTGANQIVQLDGSGKLPAVDGSALTNITATGYSGVLPVANGGTNSNTALSNNRLMVSSGGKIVEASAMTNGQIVVGSTGAAPAIATLGNSNGITITPGAGSLSIGTNATDANTASTIVSRDASGNFAAGAVTNTSNILKGSTSGQITMTVPGTVTPYTLTWPSGVGSAGSFLTTDASGNLSWGSPAAIADSSYAAKGAVRFDTDAATSGVSVTSGVASVNAGTGANQIVKLNGSAQLPAVDGSLLTNLSAGNIASGVLPIARGGTNNGSLAVTAGGILYMDGTRAQTTTAGTTGQALLSAGTGAPAFGNLSVPAGGTGTTSFAANSLVMANGTGSALTGMTCSLGEILKWNGTAWSCSTGAGAIADAAYTSSNKGVVAFETDAATSGVSVTSGVARVNTGTNANQIVKLDGSAKLPAVDGSALTNVTASSYSGVLPIANGGTNSSTALNNNKVMVSSSGAIVEGNGFGSANTASTFVTRDASGNFAAGAITNNSNILKGATSGAITMTVPGTVAPYTLTWPAGVGGAGSFLTTDASGNLSWGSPAAVADASYAAKGAVQGLTDAATSGLNIASGVISVNAGTSANQIVKLDGSSKLPAVDGSALTNLAAGNITGTVPVANGGTGQSSYTAGDVLYATGATATAKLGIGASGTILTSSGSAPQWSTTDSLGFFKDGGNTFTATATLGANSNHNLEIETNGSTKMTVESGGDVGIGITNPAYRLDVNRQGLVANDSYIVSRFSESNSGSGISLGYVVNSGGTAPKAGFVSTSSPGVDLYLGPSTNNGAITILDSNSNVGIGTTSPADRLTVVSPGAASLQMPVRVQNNNSTNGAAAGIAFKNGTSSNDSLYKSAIAFERTASNGRGKMHILNSSEDNTNNVTLTHSVLTLDHSGKVGIGTTDPKTKFDVEGMNLKFGQLGIVTNYPEILFNSYYNGTTTVYSSNESSFSIVHDQANDLLKINTAAAGTADTATPLTPRVVFKVGGEMGLGNTDPSTILDLSGALTQRGMTAPTVSPAGQGRIYFDATSNKFRVSQHGGAYVDLVPGATADSSYSTKGLVQGLTDAATSGLIFNSGVISVNSGTSANQIIKLNGSAQLPAVDGSLLTNLSAANITSGTLPVDRGGTGATTLTSNGVLLGNGTSAVTATAAGAAHSVLRVPSGGGAPGFGSIDLSQSAAVTGTLGPANGGTGQSAYTAGDMLYATGAAAVSKLGIGASGTILTSSGSAPQWSTISSLGFFTNGGDSFGAAATLGTNDNYALNIETNGQPRIIVKNDGFVGIGGAVPDYLLEVIQPSAANDTQTTVARFAGGADATLGDLGLAVLINPSATATSRYVSLSVGDNVAMRPLILNRAWNGSVGNVGIGLTDPQALFEIGASGTTAGTHEQISLRSQRTAIAAAGLVGGINFRSNDTNLTAPGTVVATVNAVARTAHTAASLNTDLVFQTTSGTTKSEKMRIGYDGRVGIGTNAPNDLFEIRDTSTAFNTATTMGGQELQLNSAFATNNYGERRLAFYKSRGTFSSPAAVQDGDVLSSIYSNAHDGTSQVQSALIRTYADGTISTGIVPTRMEFQVMNGTSLDTRMTIDSTGFVGIGTATPGTILDITGAFTQRGMAAPTVSAAGQGRIYFDSTANKFKVSQNGAAYVDLVSAGTTADATYASKGLVQGLTDAATSGLVFNSGVINVNSGTSANQIVKLNGSAQLPAVDGSLLTNLNAANFTSGVLPINRGGTNNGSLGVTAGGILYMDGTRAQTTAAGTLGQALISAAAGAPAFGTLGVGGGGTGLTAGVSGGIPYYSATNTMASSALLTQYGVVLGGGAGAAPTATAAGTANQVLRVPSGGGAPSFGTAMIAGGGTGTTSFASNALIIANGTGSALTHITCTSGQILKWNGTSWGCVADSFSEDAYNNLVAGTSALSSNTNNSQFNVALGYQAAMNMRPAAGTASNVAIGNEVMRGSATPASNTGYQNVAIGDYGLWGLTSGHHNIAIGENPLVNNSSGTHNIAFGHNSMLSNTTGAMNFAAGSEALYSNTTGYDNIAIGQQALRSNVNGSYNIAFGYLSQADMQVAAGNEFNVSFGNQSMRGSAVKANNTGVNNFAVGYQALGLLSNGEANTAIGLQALYNNSTGNNNLAVGSWALSSSTSGSNNLALGWQALYSNETASNNIALGTGALKSNKISDINIAIGLNAQERMAVDNGSDGGNIAIGREAMRGSPTPANNTGTWNVAIGDWALQNMTTASFNIAIGNNPLQNTTSGQDNVAIGNNPLQGNTTGTENVAIGTNPLQSNTTGLRNVAIGDNALVAQTIVNDNIGIGAMALGSNIVSDENVSIGAWSQELMRSTNGSNTSLGASALRGSTTIANNTGYYNTAVGAAALYSLSTGFNNVAIGLNAGLTATSANATTTGNYNTFIGANTGFASATQRSYSTAIGAAATVDANSTIVLGRAADDRVVIGATGTANTSYKFHVTADATRTAVGGTIAWSVASDSRYKTNVAPISDALAIVSNLEGVRFDWDHEKYPNQFAKSRQVGFIAQQVEKHVPEIVHTDDNGYKAVQYSQLVAVLTEAVKELYAKFLSKTGEHDVQLRNLASELEKKDAEIKALRSYICSKDPKASICQ